MIRSLALAACLLAGVPSPAATGPDPLHAPECLRARAELDAALAAPAAARDARLERARQRALHACLGTERAGRRRSGAPDRPHAVGPVPAPRPAQPTQPAVLPSSPPPSPPTVTIPRAATITTCDPAGCWDAQGRRLNRMGPLLVAPEGACRAQGGLVTCP